MNKNVITLMSIVATFFIVACSSDDNNSDDNNQEEIISEILINNSPWTFTEYQLIEVTDAGPSTITQQDIESHFNSEFNQLQITFNSNGTGLLNAPILTSTITWELQDDGNNLLMVVNELTPPDDETYFINLSVSQTELRMDNASALYDDSVDYDVAIFGTMVFNN